MVNALRTITVVYTGDIQNTVKEIASNSNSPGAVDLITLNTGANTITVPTGGSVPTGCTIVMPVGNLVAVHLKGVTGDTGILLHLTDPTSIALDPTQASFVLTAASSLVGVRLIWS